MGIYIKGINKETLINSNLAFKDYPKENTIEIPEYHGDLISKKELMGRVIVESESLDNISPENFLKIVNRIVEKCDVIIHNNRSVEDIDNFCDALKEAWKKYPELRFTQFVYDIASMVKKDMFYIEDDEILLYVKNIDSFLK